MDHAVIIIISLIISLTWLYYLRLIDVFENEKPFNIGLTFALGVIIPNVIYLIHYYVYDPLHISNSRNPVFSFLFFVFGVGFLEEIVKIIPVIFMLRFVKNAINEPLDYLKYACVSALGFGFGENIEYGEHYGYEVLLDRSILSVPTHMFLSAIFIYGYVLYKYQGKSGSAVFGYAGLSVLAHGLYDYMLDFELGTLGYFLTLVLFMLMVNAFIDIMNNSLNNSPFYSPKNSIDQEKIRNKLSLYYIPVIGGVLILNFFMKDPERSIVTVITFLFLKFMVLYLIIVRLSRYTIIPSYWKPLSPELPFSLRSSSREGRNEHYILGGFFVIKGESYNDWHISRLYQENILVIPYSRNKSYLNRTFTGFIEEKIFQNKKVLYKVKLFLPNTSGFNYFVLIAKTNGITHTEDNHPIAGIYSINENKKLVFREWVILKEQT